MGNSEKDIRILQIDGQVVYVPPTGKAVLLARLAHESGYRIDTLCEALGISPRHMRRMFTEGLGISPKKWFKYERMVYARNLLRSGLSIKEVSERLGFSGQKDFYSEFKEYYGLPPSGYLSRESNRVMESLGLVR